MVDKREITPELLTRITVLLFQHVSVKAVLEERIRFDRLSADDIARLMMKAEHYSLMQSEESCKALAYSVIDYVTQKTAWQKGHTYRPEERFLNVLDLLMLTLQDLLVMNRNHLECRYEEIFSWRMIVRNLGEELPLSAQHARWDHEHHKAMRRRYDDFAWPYVTTHNNKQLNMIIRRGVSEHHCHLWGSTPFFHVSWVNLMNNLTDSKYQNNLRKLNPTPWSAEAERKRRSNVEDVGAAKEHYGELAQTRAAWIRLYLCERLSGITDSTKKYYDLENVRHYENWRRLLMSRDSLQSELNSYSHRAKNCCDYALSFASLEKPEFAGEYHILIGERWLYYQIFRDYCKPPQQRTLSFDDYNLFFVYFLIRLRIRHLMVQNNNLIGFDNFHKIQKRKAFFLGDPESERALARLAINETLRKEYVYELEVRISPDGEQVKRLEAAVNSEMPVDSVDQFLQMQKFFCYGENKSDKDDLRKRFYYVFHFLKKKDPRLEPDASYERALQTGLICRHDQQRLFFMDQAKEIIRFRETEPHLAGRVLGIDAASAELGCRPEVFGTVYRLLGDHQFAYGGYLEKKQMLPALGKTYHVGEDFPDIVDGLRAIDEVINFLDFDCGDRLGHAIVLGINAEEWYEQKNREISLSVQDYLDNLAWFYHALNRFSLPDYSALKERIVRDFEYWFRIVYRNNVDDENIKRMMRRARLEWYDKTDEDHGRYHEHVCHFDIMTYYRAWMLRGDDPSCYVDGYFKKPAGSSLMIPEERAKVCTNYPPRYEERYISEYSLLNYLYQFNDSVRRDGARIIKVDISSEYIRAVKTVQIEMRHRLAKRGISIETNPTSNVLIGTFRKYAKHPILSFYNRGLLVSDQEEQECAQLQVSINTDDSGVFYTNLETEYALLARSVEQIVDEDKHLRFKKTDIYTWLDNIRTMGNDQTFRYQEESK